MSTGPPSKVFVLGTVALLLFACRSVDKAPETTPTDSNPVADEPTANSSDTGPPVADTARAPTVEAKISRQLRALASSLPSNARLDRVVLPAMAYPRTEAEDEAMGGYALLLLASVVHDPTELPLASVIVEDAAGELPLQRAALQRSDVPDSTLGPALGTHRTDELYYVPVFVTRISARVVVNFGKNRRQLEALKFPLRASEDTFPAGMRVIERLKTPDVRVATNIANDELGWAPE